jgi:hypothetical protein
MAYPTSTPYYGQPVNVGLYSNFTSTTGGTLIKTGEGVLYGITFNKPVATGVITIYDGLTTGGTVIATITVPSSPQVFTWGPFNGGFYYQTGLFIVIATAAQDLTVSYR